MKLILSTAALAVLALATPAAHAQGKQCFRPHDVQNFTVADDDKTVWIRSGTNQVFRLDLSSQCPGLSFRQNIELNSVGNVGLVCSTIELDLRIRTDGVSVPCTIGSMQALTPAEVAALPKGLKP